MTKDIEERKKLTFEQAEGIEPLPSQLKLRDVSPKLRAILWHEIHSYLSDAVESVYGESYLDKPWSTILKDEHIYRRHRMADDFESDPAKLIRETRGVFEIGNFASIFGWLEFVLKHPACPPGFARDIDGTLRHCQAAYRVVEQTVICPIASDTEHSTIIQAFADLTTSQFKGARSHLRNAASHLTAGKYADSVRESIHAVEAVGRSLDPTADILPKALAKLEQKISIHPAMKKGFTSLYAYGSRITGLPLIDVKGVGRRGRHLSPTVVFIAALSSLSNIRTPPFGCHCRSPTGQLAETRGMALAKHLEEILTRRRENGARIVDEFLHPRETLGRSDSSDPFNFSPEELAALRALVQRFAREAKERLAREMTLVFKLNKERTRLWGVGYLTKGEAAEIACAIPGELLDLDALYGGIHIFNDHLFISDDMLFSAIQRYGSDVTSADLIQKLASEYEFPPRYSHKVAA